MGRVGGSKTEQNRHAQESGKAAGIVRPVRAPAYDFDPSYANPAHPQATAAPEFLTASTHANESGLCHAKRAGAHANNSGSLPDGANQTRVICGAKRRRDGQPCQGLSVPGKRRCKWHGGCSTGLKTIQGQATAFRNLRQFASTNFRRKAT